MDYYHPPHSTHFSRVLLVGGAIPVVSHCKVDEPARGTGVKVTAILFQKYQLLLNLYTSRTQAVDVYPACQIFRIPMKLIEARKLL